MATALIIAQTLFYFVVSIVIIAIGILFIVGAYYLVRIAKELEKISRHVEHVSAGLASSLEDIVGRLSALPILSLFIKKQHYDKK